MGTKYITSSNNTYKVYTALLTQSGGDNPLTQTSGATQEGVSYIISIPIGAAQDWDFSNVGGPIAPDNFSFVATSSDVPNTYGSATLNYNTGAPVVTVLENTIGNIVWTYEGTGQYSAVVPDFIQEKVLVFYGAGTAGSNSYVVQAYVNNFSPFGIWIDTSDYSTGGLSADNVLQETPIEIRVYN